jgi:membrane protease YdiL (CAAX protease family)
MAIIPNLPSYNAKSPAHQLFAALFAVVIVGSVLFLLFILAGSRIMGTDPGLFEDPSNVTGTKELAFIKYTLIVQDISFFIIPALIILTIMNPDHKSGILNISLPGINDFIPVTILALCAFPVTGLAGQLNSGMVLPDWLSGVETWMKVKEKHADQLLGLIMEPEGISGMLFNILIIAALPAISEELIFRGVFQKIFQNLLRSGNLSVWLTSFLFSAIHLQFYGFLPRLILGLIFGYLFLWTRNLWLPVIAHFINNAIPTAGAYFRGWETINESSFPAPAEQIAGVIITLTIGLLILFWFRRRSGENKNGNADINIQTGR